MSGSKSPKVLYESAAAKEYFFDEGCHILEIYNDPLSESFSIVRARVEINVETKLHSLSDTIEHYVIIQGKGTATIDSIEYHVKDNDVLHIGENVSQKIRNSGKIDLIFLAICAPRFTKECYNELSV